MTTIDITIIPRPQLSYTVRPGDTLWDIAKGVYGDGRMYTHIYDANRRTVGSNPDLIYAGQRLRIPT